MCFRPAAIEEPTICPACGTKNAPTSKKCRECGEKLDHVLADALPHNQDAPAPVPPTAPTAPAASAAPAAPKAPTA